ncbi:L-threonine 3-dehydrogenase [Galdieria sulphuraria]|nr:L-threonine 3-dehydrogenase [Galdieria sulphuraria]
MTTKSVALFRPLYRLQVTTARYICSKALEDTPSCFTARKTAESAQSLSQGNYPVLQHYVYPVVENTRMKALVKAEAAPGLVLRDDVGIPSIGSTEVLIKIKKTSICGTDLHIFVWDEWSKRTVPVPLTIGHEYVGHIAAVGSEVTGWKEGDRVTGEGHITCGYCRNCRAGKRHLCRNTIGVGVNRPGAFAEYLSLPAGNVFRVHPSITDDIASFMDPLGNAVHSCLSFDLVGEDVLITGAGPIGMMSAAICKHSCGADVALNISKCEDPVEELKKTMKQLGMTEGFDIGLEMSGNAQAFASMLETMNHGGRISLLGIPPSPFAIDWNKVVFKGIVVKGIYGRKMFETWYKMSNMLVGGLDKRIQQVMTHQLPYDEFEKAFDFIRDGKSGKIVLNWDE